MTQPLMDLRARACRAEAIRESGNGPSVVGSRYRVTKRVYDDGGSIVLRRAAVCVGIVLTTVVLAGCAGAELLKAGQQDARTSCSTLATALNASERDVAMTGLLDAFDQSVVAAGANADYMSISSGLAELLDAIDRGDRPAAESALAGVASACNAVDPDPDWSDAVKHFLS
jgi:hypothetical protein